MTRERLGAAESVNAMKDRKIDAFFWVGGLPTAAVTDLAATPGIKIKMIDSAQLLPAMNEEVRQPLRRGRHSQIDLSGHGRGQPHDHRDEHAGGEREHERPGGLRRRQDDIRQAPRSDAVHKAAADIKLENQKAAASPIPWHPGAIKYFAEQGIKLK